MQRPGTRRELGVVNGHVRKLKNHILPIFMVESGCNDGLSSDRVIIKYFIKTLSKFCNQYKKIHCGYADTARIGKSRSFHYLVRDCYKYIRGTRQTLDSSNCTAQDAWHGRHGSELKAIGLDSHTADWRGVPRSNTRSLLSFFRFRLLKIHQLLKYITPLSVEIYHYSKCFLLKELCHTNRCFVSIS